MKASFALLLLSFSFPALAFVKASKEFLRIQTQADKQLTEILLKARNPSEMLELMGPNLDSESQKVLRDLVRGNENSSLRIGKEIDGSFVIYRSEKESSFAFLGFDEMGDFKMVVDKVEIALQPADPARKFRNEILEAIPSTEDNRPTLMNPVHASRVSRRGFVTMGAAVYRLNKVNCAYQKTLIDGCGQKSAKNEDILAAVRYAQKWEKVSLTCDSGKADLKTCLQKTVKARNLQVDAAFKDYLL